MSTHAYCCYGFGLIFEDRDEFEEVLKANGLVNEYDMTDIAGRLVNDDIAEDMETEYVISDTSGRKEGDAGSWMYTIDASKALDAFKPAYNSIDEVVAEFSDIKFPEGFNVASHIGYYQYVVFC